MDENESIGIELSRRTVIETGTTALLLTALPRAAGASDDAGPPPPSVTVELQINGTSHTLTLDPRTPLLDALREHLALTGSKKGCDHGQCGACTVLIDGQPRYACMILALEAEGKAITTIEGLAQGDELGPVQKAFWDNDALQCGYCTPGQIMAAEGLLRVNPNPSLEEVRQGMSGNLCRCGSYAHIFKAVQAAAKLKRTA
jgi:xanthine dehydrogenase YagT iron-sulfur-binding subunit